LAIVAIIREYQFSKIIKQKSGTAHSKNHPAGSGNALRSMTGWSFLRNDISLISLMSFGFG